MNMKSSNGLRVLLLALVVAACLGADDEIGRKDVVEYEIFEDEDVGAAHEEDQELSLEDEVLFRELERDLATPDGVKELCKPGSPQALVGRNDRVCGYTPFYRNAKRCKMKVSSKVGAKMCQRTGGRLCRLQEVLNGETFDSDPITGCGINSNWIWTRTNCRRPPRSAKLLAKANGSAKQCRGTAKTAWVRCCMDVPLAGNLTFLVDQKNGYNEQTFVEAVGKSFLSVEQNGEADLFVLQRKGIETVFRVQVTSGSVTFEEMLNQLKSDAPTGWDLASLAPAICFRDGDICSNACTTFCPNFSVCNCASRYGVGVAACSSTTQLDVPLYANSESVSTFQVRYAGKTFSLAFSFADFPSNCGPSCSSDPDCQSGTATFNLLQDGLLEIFVPPFTSPLLLDSLIGTLNRDLGAAMTNLFPGLTTRPNVGSGPAEAPEKNVALTFSNSHSISSFANYDLTCVPSTRTLYPIKGTQVSKPGGLSVSRLMDGSYASSFQLPSTDTRPEGTCRDMFINVSHHVGIEGPAFSKMVNVELATFGIPQVKYGDFGKPSGETMDIDTSINSALDDLETNLKFSSYTRGGRPFHIAVHDKFEPTLDPLKCTAQYAIFGTGKVNGAKLFDGNYLSRDGLLHMRQSTTQTVCDLTVPTGAIFEAGRDSTFITFDVELEYDSSIDGSRRRLLDRSMMRSDRDRDEEDLLLMDGYDPRLLGKQKRNKKVKAKGGHKAKGNPSPKFRRRRLFGSGPFTKPHIEVSFPTNDSSGATDVNVPITTNTIDATVDLTVEEVFDDTKVTVNETIQCRSGYAFSIEPLGNDGTHDQDGNLIVSRDESGNTEASLKVPSSEFEGTGARSSSSIGTTITPPLRIATFQEMTVVDNKNELGRSFGNGGSTTSAARASYVVTDDIDPSDWENTTEGQLVTRHGTDGVVTGTLGFQAGASSIDLNFDIDRTVVNDGRRLLLAGRIHERRALDSQKKKKNVKAKGGHKAEGNPSPKFRRLATSLDESPFFGTIRVQETLEDDGVSVVYRLPLEDVYSAPVGGRRALDRLDITFEAELDVEVDDIIVPNFGGRRQLEQKKTKKVKCKNGHKAEGTPSPKFRRRILEGRRFLTSHDFGADHLRVDIKGETQQVTVSNDIWGGTNESLIEAEITGTGQPRVKLSSNQTYGVGSPTYQGPSENDNEPDGRVQIGDTKSGGGFEAKVTIPSSEFQAHNANEDEIVVATSTNLNFEFPDQKPKSTGSFAGATSYTASRDGLDASTRRRRRRLSQMGSLDVVEEESSDTNVQLNLDSSYNLNVDMGGDGNNVQVDATISNSRRPTRTALVKTGYSFPATSGRRRQLLMDRSHRHLLEISPTAGGSFSLNSPDGQQLGAEITLPELSDSGSTDDEPVTTNIQVQFCDTNPVSNACMPDQNRSINLDVSTTLDGAAARRRVLRLRELENAGFPETHHRRILQTNNVFNAAESRRIGFVIGGNSGGNGGERSFTSTTSTTDDDIIFVLPLAGAANAQVNGVVQSGPDGNTETVDILVSSEGDGAAGELNVVHRLGGNGETKVSVPLPNQLSRRKSGSLGTETGRYSIQTRATFVDGQGQETSKVGSLVLDRNNSLINEQTDPNFTFSVNADGSVNVNFNSEEDGAQVKIDSTFNDGTGETKREFFAKTGVRRNTGGSRNTPFVPTVIGIDADGDAILKIPLQKGEILEFELILDGEPSVVDSVDSRFEGALVTITKKVGGGVIVTKEPLPTFPPTPRPTHTAPPTFAPSPLVTINDPCEADCSTCNRQLCLLSQENQGACVLRHGICYKREESCRTVDCRDCRNAGECYYSEVEGGCQLLFSSDEFEEYAYYYADYYYTSVGERQSPKSAITTKAANQDVFDRCRFNERTQVSNVDRMSLCEDRSNTDSNCQSVTATQCATQEVNICDGGQGPFCSVNRWYNCPEQCSRECKRKQRFCADASKSFCSANVFAHGCTNSANGLNVGQLCPGSCPGFCTLCEDRDYGCFDILSNVYNPDTLFGGSSPFEFPRFLMGFEVTSFLENKAYTSAEELCSVFLPNQVQIKDVCPHTCAKTSTLKNSNCGVNSRMHANGFPGPCKAFNSPAGTNVANNGHCVLPFKSNSNAASYSTKCVPYSELRPFNPDKTIFPESGMVCPTTEYYNSNDPNVRMQWGYCDCPKVIDEPPTEEQQVPKGQICPSEPFTVLLYSQLYPGVALSHLFGEGPTAYDGDFKGEIRVDLQQIIYQGRTTSPGPDPEDIIKNLVTFYPQRGEGGCAYKIGKKIYDENQAIEFPTSDPFIYTTFANGTTYLLESEPLNFFNGMELAVFTPESKTNNNPWVLRKPVSPYRGRHYTLTNSVNDYISLEKLEADTFNYFLYAGDDKVTTQPVNLGEYETFSVVSPLDYPLSFRKMSFLPYSPSYDIFTALTTQLSRWHSNSCTAAQLRTKDYCQCPGITCGPYNSIKAINFIKPSSNKVKPLLVLRDAYRYFDLLAFAGLKFLDLRGNLLGIPDATTGCVPLYSCHSGMTCLLPSNVKLCDLPVPTSAPFGFNDNPN